MVYGVWYMVNGEMVYGNEALGPSGLKLGPRGRASLTYAIYHSTIYHIPYTIYHIPFTMYHLPYSIHHLPLTIYHLPFAIYNLHHLISFNLILNHLISFLNHDFISSYIMTYVDLWSCSDVVYADLCMVFGLIFNDLNLTLGWCWDDLGIILMWL